MLRFWFIIFSLFTCSATTRNFNESDYQRMPPLFLLDEYEPCLAEEGGKYCMLQLKLFAEPGNELMQLINDYSDVIYKHYDHSVLDRGVCVQKTCQKYISSGDSTEDLQRSLETCFSESLQREYGLNAKVSILNYCDHHNEPHYIDTWDWTMVIVILGIIIINIVASFCDYIWSKSEKDGNALVVSFSLQRNWKRLMMTQMTEDKTQNLQFFHGIRVIINTCVVMAHTQIIYAAGYTKNPEDSEKSFDFSSYYLMYSGLMIVQIFFFMSGFLMVYHLRNAENTRTFTIWDIPKITVMKAMRLLPSIAMILTICTSWLRHIGSGPLWKLFVSESIVADCRTSWWRHLIFVNNYMQEKNYCLLTNWHLAADMQVFLVGLTAYVLTRGRARSVVFGALILLGALAPALHTLIQNIDSVILMPEIYRSWKHTAAFFTHLMGHNHLLGYAIGMVTAAKFCDWQNKESHVNSMKYRFLQYMAFAIIPFTLFSKRVFFQDEQAPRLIRAAFNVSMRLLLGLACAILTITLSSKVKTYLKSFLEWRYWAIPSRLSYCVFLMHIVFIHIIMGMRMQLSVFLRSNILTSNFYVTMLSYLAATIMYLMVEAPFAALFRSLVKKPSTQHIGNVNETKKKKKL